MCANQTNLFDISVVVPIYNVEEVFLRPCLDSVANQTKSNIEVILVDDGSTDNSGAIADEYAEKYDHFVCYHIANNGLGHARNFGAEKASGKYLYFIDSDDEIAHDLLEKMMLAAERNGSDLTICAVERFDSVKEKPSNLHMMAFKDLDSVTHITKDLSLIYDTTSWNKLIKREFWEKYGFAFPEHILYEDIPVTIPLHYLANNVSVVRSFGYKWRVRDMASKSITQNTTDLTNFYDRIKILKMLDAFFEKNVKEEDLILEKEKKALKVDLLIFVYSCLSLDENQAREIMAGIREYILSSVSQKALDSVNIVEKRLYEALLDEDFERFMKLAAFRRTEFGNCPYFEKDNRVFIKLPAELFDEEYADITNDVAAKTPVVFVNRADSEGSAINIRSTIYVSKVNIADETQQAINAFLLNEFTGEEIPLKTVPCNNSEITNRRGTSFSKLTGEKESYNYDGTGFIIKLEPGQMPIKDERYGKWVIAVRYKNRFSSGTVVLNSLSTYQSRRADGITCVSEEVMITLSESEGRTVNVTVNKIENKLEKCRADSNALVLKTSNPNPLFARNRKSGCLLAFKTRADNEFEVRASDLETDAEYEVLTESSCGELLPLVRTSKAVTLISKRSGAFVVRSNKTNHVAVRVLTSATFLEEFRRQGDTLILETVSAGDFDCARYSIARIVVDDALTNRKVVMARSKCRIRNERAYCAFHIDFSKERIQKNFYESSREIFVEYANGDGQIERHRVFSSKFISEYFEFGSLGIKVFRFLEGYLKLKLDLMWSDEEASYSKRKALVRENYPKFREAPINNKLIVFESTWGTKFNCNPKAIYEYINKHYPQYECVWSLVDPRIPISGKAKRVRKGSLEYYKVLATAKFLVNNVNFEDDYVKRKGQIEVQTMHGTPLKTFGLDVEDEMRVPGARERFLMRSSRWDHLIVQGRFVEEMSYQMFHFEKNILKTGYPRTDVLYETKDIDAIKKKIGIPLDKKVILYMPTWRIKKKFTMPLELEKMKNAVSDDYVLMVRVHYLAADSYDFVPDNQFVFDLTNYGEVQDLYHISDMLITDYSSVMFDYALLDKPMMFYAYDLETYSEATRGVYFDIRKEAPGPILYTTDEVIHALKNLDEEMKKVANRTQAFKEEYLTYECRNSAEKVVKEVLKPSPIATFLFKAKRKIKKSLKRK